MMRILVAFVVATALMGCEQLLAPYDRAVEVPETPELAMRGGAVTWELLSSDCPADVQDLWRGEDRGYALIEGDTIELMFETTPLLTGTLGAPEAVTGQVTFMGDDGADVTCVVAGSAALAGAPGAPEAVEGEMTEALSSAGALNCVSHARYRLVFDH